MGEVFRVRSNDPRIFYGIDWNQAANYAWTKLAGSRFGLLFRGTGIKVYGHSTETEWNFELDGNITMVILNSTDAGTSTSLIFRVDNLTDGDHELVGSVWLHWAPELLFAAVDFIEIENSSGGGFDLLNAGPNAKNVPEHAAIVDDNSLEIIYNNTSKWSHEGYIRCYERSFSYTSAPGGSLSYSFDGVAIWYYGIQGTGVGFFSVSIDGSPPQRFNASSNVEMNQRLLWSNTSLGLGRHTVTLAHDDVGTTFGLDFFRILRENNASTPLLTTPLSTAPLSTAPLSTAPLSTTPTASFTALSTVSQQVTSTSKTNTVPLVVGLTLGLLTIATVILGGLWYLNRRVQRQPTGLDSHPTSPYTVPPMTKANQESGLPRDHKRRLQLARRPGAPMLTSDPTMSFGLNELESPPSYQSRKYEVRADR